MRANVVSLPVKADVLAALGSATSVALATDRWREVNVHCTVEEEDGSGESWLLKGTVVIGGTAVVCRGYFRTDHPVRFGSGKNFGVLEVDLPKPEAQPEPEPAQEPEWVISVFPNGPGGYISAFPTSTRYGITGGEVTVFLTDDIQLAKRFPDSHIRANWATLQKSTWQVLPAPE